jgi:hypothetical protein
MQTTVLYNVIVIKRLCNSRVERAITRSAPAVSHEALRILARIIANYHIAQSADHTTAPSGIQVNRESRRKKVAANARYRSEHRRHD